MYVQCKQKPEKNCTITVMLNDNEIAQKRIENILRRIHSCKGQMCWEGKTVVAHKRREATRTRRDTCRGIMALLSTWFKSVNHRRPSWHMQRDYMPRFCEPNCRFFAKLDSPLCRMPFSPAFILPSASSELFCQVREKIHHSETTRNSY